MWEGVLEGRMLRRAGVVPRVRRLSDVLKGWRPEGVRRCRSGVEGEDTGKSCGCCALKEKASSVNDGGILISLYVWPWKRPSVDLEGGYV